MVSVTLSIPKEVKELMSRFSEMNWSGWIRKSIENKAKQLAWKEEMLKKLKQDKEFEDWSVKMGSKVNEGIIKSLKKEKLI